ncbi:MAG: helix-turn-helix domain-containing protein [Proteobacteria bacterium]|nr:helix-turn-helix domain-containing protein [Pseudomonadota bacterium]
MQTNPILQEYVKPEDLARELGINRRTLDRWHALGDAPCRMKINSKILYRREAITDWLRSREEVI